MLQLAGELADGVLLYAPPLEWIKSFALRNLELGARRSGLNTRKIDVGCWIPCSISRETDQAVGAPKRFLARWFSKPGQGASSLFRWMGWADLVTKIGETWRKGDADSAFKMVPDHLVRSLTAAGDIGVLRDKVNEYKSAGVDLVVIRHAKVGEDARENLNLILKAVLA